MLWIKFLLGCLIVVFCTFLGHLASGKYRQKGSFYTQLYDFNEKYLSELKFARKPIREFLAKQNFKGDFSLIMNEYFTNRDEEGKNKLPYLSKEEKSAVYEYLGMLGKGDSHSQSGYFSAQREELLKMKEKCVKDAKNYTDLYLKLGLLAGLAVVILIV